MSEQDQKIANLERWKSSAEPEAWVSKHIEGWNHNDWLELLVSLQKSRYWPMEEVAIGRHIEMLRDNMKSKASASATHSPRIPKQSPFATARKHYIDARDKVLATVAELTSRGALSSQDLYRIGDELIELRRSTIFVSWSDDLSRIEKCYSCAVAGGSPMYAPYVPTEGGCACSRCARHVLLLDYVVCSFGDSRHRHKAVLQVGEILNSLGGTDAMRGTAQRYAQIGDLTSLSECWHGVGKWQA
jgi:hypothetical protein